MAAIKQRRGTWEVPEEAWDSVRQQVQQYVEEQARFQRVVSYSEVADHVDHINDGQSHALHYMLGEIQRECHAAGRALLPAIVTYKNQPNEVGDGFFRMAQHLGYNVGRNAAQRWDFWWQQVQAVFTDYSNADA